MTHISYTPSQFLGILGQNLIIRIQTLPRLFKEQKGRTSLLTANRTMQTTIAIMIIKHAALRPAFR